MKTKIIFLSILGLAVIKPQIVNAQGPYAGVILGYGMSMSSQTLLINDISNSNFDRTYTSVKGSFGKGINTGLLFGYMFNENMGGELGVSYLIGGKTKATYLKYNSGNTEYDISAKMIRITPSIRLALSGEGKINPYMKVGMVIGVGGKIIANTMFSDIGCNCGNSESTLEYTGGISLGGTSSIGANYKMNDKLSLFGEIGIISQSWAPAKRVYTKSTLNGVDRLPNLTTSQKETDYVKTYTVSGTTPAPDSSPSQSLKEYFPFSSWGINIGLNFAF